MENGKRQKAKGNGLLRHVASRKDRMKGVTASEEKQSVTASETKQSSNKGNGKLRMDNGEWKKAKGNGLLRRVASRNDWMKDVTASETKQSSYIAEQNKSKAIKGEE